MHLQKVSFSPNVPTPAINTSPYSTRFDNFTLRLEMCFPLIIVSNMSDWLISMMPLSSFTSILGNEPVENTSPLIIKSFNGLERGP